MYPMFFDDTSDDEEMFLPMCIRSWPGKKTGECAEWRQELVMIMTPRDSG
jgi:hypothetical protein